MTTITVRLSEEDKKLFQEISKSKGQSLSDWIRESLLEQLQDEYDLKIYKEYLENKEYETTTPLAALIEELGLEDEILG